MRALIENNKKDYYNLKKKEENSTLSFTGIATKKK